MQDYYAARALEYDQVYLKPERQADLRQMEAWVSECFAGHHVLELACGTGHWTRFIAQTASQLVATDVVPETMALARQRVPPERARFQRADAYDLPVLDPKPDAAFAGFWLSHVSLNRLTGFLGGLHRALQAGARVVFIDNRFVEGSSSAITERDADGNTYQTRLLADGSRHRVLKNFPSAHELTARMASMGIQAEHRQWDHYWALSYST